jgi:hypothetical protein
MDTFARSKKPPAPWAATTSTTPDRISGPAPRCAGPIHRPRTTLNDRTDAGARRAPEREDSMSMYKAIEQNAERWALLVFYVMLVGTMFIEVLRREVLSYSSIWGEEIVRYSFIYLAWIGAAAAVKERGHIRIDVIMQYVGPRERRCSTSSAIW